METEAIKKFTWVIKKFSLQPECVISKKFVIGGCNWCIAALPKGTSNFPKHFSLYLMLDDYKTLPCEWVRHAKYRLIVVNQLSDKLSIRREIDFWFNRTNFLLGCPEMISIAELNAKKGGFVVNDEVEIVVEVDDVQEVTQPLKRTKLNHELVVSSSVDVNGFQVLPSQAESVRRIFEKHPDMALEFRVKKQHLRTSCINLLLTLIDTLCQSLQDLSIDDLNQGVNTLTYLKCSGFKVDWLECKLQQVKKTKNEEQIGATRMKELEDELKVFTQKCSDIEALLENEKEELKGFKKKCSYIEALLEKEKAKVLAATRAHPLTLDDVV